MIDKNLSFSTKNHVIKPETALLPIWSLFLIILSAVSAVSQTPLQLKPCQINGVKEKVLCGTYEVFENRPARKGRKIPLNIVVLQSLSSNPAPDPLVALAGGPGQAATDGAANDAQRFAEIRRERDILLVDQRGTGRSNKLTCELGNLNQTIQAFVGGEFLLEKLAACRAELEKHADLRFYTTPVAMDDLEEICRQLGYKKINLYGGSYGANAALVYLQRHPENVRTVTLRAISSLNLLNSSKYSQETLDRLFADCAKDASCANAYPNLRQDFQTVLERLGQTPVKVSAKDPRTGESIEIPVTRNLFAGAINRFLNDSGAQRGIPSGIKRSIDGDFQFMRSFAGQLAGITNFFSFGMNLSITCPEGRQQFSEKDITNAVKGTFRGDALIKSVSNICKEWPRGTLPKNYFEPVKSAVPVLIFSGMIDPSNPAAEGDRISKYLPNSLHLKMEGIAHDFPGCGLKVTAQFIALGTTQNLDSSCIKELRRQPFVIPNKP